MKTATELLAEMIAIHADPQKGAAELYLWLHQAVDEVKEVVERGDDSARLDWLEHGLYVNREHRHRDAIYYEMSLEANQGGKSLMTLRAAIDGARGEGE